MEIHGDFHHVHGDFLADGLKASAERRGSKDEGLRKRFSARFSALVLVVIVVAKSLDRMLLLQHSETKKQSVKLSSPCYSWCLHPTVLLGSLDADFAY